MKPVKIFIENNNSDFSIKSKYVFSTLFNFIGLPIIFSNQLDNSEVDIYYGNSIPNANFKVFIKQENSNKAQIQNHIIKDEIVYLFFNSENKKTIEFDSNKTIILNDIVYSAYFLLSFEHEKNSKKNNYGHHLLNDNYLYKNKLLHIPIINQYCKLIKNIFTTYNPLPVWPNNKKFAFSLTHDIDYPEMIKSIEIIRYLLLHKNKSKFSDLTDIISGKNNFWKFDENMDLEKKYGLKSAFYFCSKKSNLLKFFISTPDPFYSIKKENFKEIFKKIINNGFEIGLHSSYNAYQSETEFRNEKLKLESQIGRTLSGNRHHFWHLNQTNPNETIQIHKNIGLKYDASIMYERRSGFRTGVGFLYKFFNLDLKKEIDLWQMPTTIMDNQLFGYKKYSYFNNIHDEINVLIENIKNYEGIFISDFHVRVINETFFPNFGKTYKYILEKLISTNDFFSDTPENIIEYWNQLTKKLIINNNESNSFN